MNTKNYIPGLVPLVITTMALMSCTDDEPRQTRVNKDLRRIALYKGYTDVGTAEPSPYLQDDGFISPFLCSLDYIATIKRAKKTPPWKLIQGVYNCGILSPSQEIAPLPYELVQKVRNTRNSQVMQGAHKI